MSFLCKIGSALYCHALSLATSSVGTGFGMLVSGASVCGFCLHESFGILHEAELPRLLPSFLIQACFYQCGPTWTYCIQWAIIHEAIFTCIRQLAHTGGFSCFPTCFCLLQAPLRCLPALRGSDLLKRAELLYFKVWFRSQDLRGSSLLSCLHNPQP